MAEKRSISQAPRRQTRRSATTVDWICVGSGIGGCAAAIAGHDRGFHTVLLEKSSTIGGTTAQSGGILWVPMNDLIEGAGLQDSREEALAYLRYTGAGRNLPEYMETYVDHAPRVLRYLHEKADVRFRLMELAEFYYPIAPGSKERGRLVTCEPFPAETLGVWRDKVRLSVFYHGLSCILQGPHPALGGSDGPQVGHAGPLRQSDAGLAPWRARSDWPQLEPLLQADEAQRVAGAGLAMSTSFRRSARKWAVSRPRENIAFGIFRATSSSIVTCSRRTHSLGCPRVRPRASTG